MGQTIIGDKAGDSLMAERAKLRNMSTEDAEPAWWGFTSAT